MRVVMTVIVCGLLMGVIGGCATADVVRFKNGDQLTGTILNQEGGKLKIKSNLAGEVIVDASLVDTFSTDAPI